MRVLDLFSGIGGFSLGLERAGFTTVAFCEIDPYCRRVLARHWPDVPVYDDVRTLTAKTLADTIGNAIRQQSGRRNGSSWPSASITSNDGDARVDVICGGFPCQDISTAGKGAGITGERSGLWKEYARIIGEVRPCYVIVENVAALLHRGLADVLGDLAALGYDAEWHCIPASAVGAPHRRDRIWIVAYAARLQSGWQEQRTERQRTGPGSQSIDVADAAGGIRQRQAQRQAGHAAFGGEDVAGADQPRLEGWLRAELCQCAEQQFTGQGSSHRWDEQLWFAQSGMGRVSNGTANRVDRLRSLGNAVVPQIPEIIGRAIMKQCGV